MARRVEIYCPKCKWSPRESDGWACNCGNVWNTFETNGSCPSCGKLWKDTQCLSCWKWSAHSDWYHDFIDDEAREKEVVVEESS